MQGERKRARLKLVVTNPTMVLFMSHDGDEHGCRFSYALCDDETLFKAVAEATWFEPTAEHQNECEKLVAELRENGIVDFEDGWLSLRVGIAAVTEFLMEKIRFECSERKYEQSEQAETAEKYRVAAKKYDDLCAALQVAMDNPAGLALINALKGAE